MFLVQLAEAAAANERKTIDRNFIFAAEQQLLELEYEKRHNGKQRRGFVSYPLMPRLESLKFKELSQYEHG
jgi:bifunctional ADP-heptose synthase (sugar kinase/adenylyltransferase)